MEDGRITLQQGKELGVCIGMGTTVTAVVTVAGAKVAVIPRYWGQNAR